MGKNKNSSLVHDQFSVYFSRYAYPVEYLKHEQVTENLNLIVTIPCYNEPDLLKTLESIDDCYPTRKPVEIIVLINQPENSDTQILKQNEKTYRDAEKWIGKHTISDKKYHVIWVKDIPEKHAGVGLARKIVMDEAVRRLYKAKMFNGVITGMDADTQCDPNYLCEIENYYHSHNDIISRALFYLSSLLSIAACREIGEGLLL